MTYSLESFLVGAFLWGFAFVDLSARFFATVFAVCFAKAVMAAAAAADAAASRAFLEGFLLRVPDLAILLTGVRCRCLKVSEWGWKWEKT